MPHPIILSILSASQLLFCLTIAAATCWGESNLNYASQGPILLLPAVGISDLLISYQLVIGLRSPSPSDIPQIYDTLDSLRGGWGGGRVSRSEEFFLPPCLQTLYSTICLLDHMDAEHRPHLYSWKEILKLMPEKDYSVFSNYEKRKASERSSRISYSALALSTRCLPFSSRNGVWNCNQSFKMKMVRLTEKESYRSSERVHHSHMDNCLWGISIQIEAQEADKQQEGCLCSCVSVQIYCECAKNHD